MASAFQATKFCLCRLDQRSESPFSATPTWRPVVDYVTGDITNSGGTLVSVVADLNVDGGPHATGDSLFLDDTGNSAGNSGTMTATSGTVTTITGFGMTGDINYQEIENLNLELGSGADIVNVLGTAGTGTVTNISGNGGDDTFNMGRGQPA